MEVYEEYERLPKVNYRKKIAYVFSVPIAIVLQTVIERVVKEHDDHGLPITEYVDVFSIASTIGMGEGEVEDALAMLQRTHVLMHTVDSELNHLFAVNWQKYREYLDSTPIDLDGIVPEQNT